MTIDVLGEIDIPVFKLSIFSEQGDTRMCRLIAVVALLLPVVAGCTHQQLRFNTVSQARTVADVHTQQVLDNLAKFVHD